MSKVTIYIPGVSREHARELILQHIDSDPSLASLRELYDLDTADPDLDIINVTGLKCAGVPIGTPEFVDALARNVLPDVMMKHADGNPAAPTLVQDAIVQAIPQRGLGDNYNTLPRHVLE